MPSSQPQSPPSPRNAAPANESWRFISMLVLWAVNLSVAAFFAVASIAMTSRMALDMGRENTLYTSEGGLQQALIRYGGLSLAALLLQGLMAVLNFAVVPYLVRDIRRVPATCGKIAASCLLLMMVIAVGMLALGLPKSLP